MSQTQTATNTSPAEQARAEGVEHLVESARDALTDDIVGRLSATLSQALDFVDRLNRSGVERALPAISRLVESGDLDRVVHLARVVGAADDAMNEEMIGRLAGTLGDGIDLLDKVNRSRLADALPAISRLVESGDLDRVVHLARLIGAAEDALNDEMIARVAGVAADAMCLLEQLTRNNALGQIVTFLLRPEVQHVLMRFGEALVTANEEYAANPPRTGGLGAWIRMLKDPGTQQAMHFMGVFGKHLREEPSSTDV